MTQRSTRDRPAKAPLNREIIVSTALEILKAEGIEAVTMRRIATALDTGPASLYVYVANRNGLFQAMLDQVTATIELEQPNPAHWREQLHTLLRRMYQSLLDHPGIALLTLADPPTSEVVLGLTENLLGLLMAGGLEPQESAWACDILVTLVTGVASEDDVRRSRGRNEAEDRREQIDEIYKTMTNLPAEKFPLVTTYASQMVAGDGDERFRFAIDVVLDGLLARAAREQ